MCGRAQYVFAGVKCLRLSAECLHSSYVTLEGRPLPAPPPNTCLKGTALHSWMVRRARIPISSSPRGCSFTPTVFTVLLTSFKYPGSK